MKIIVLVKQVPDTYGERRLDDTTRRIQRSGVDLVIDEITERAIEVALTEKDTHDAEVVLMSMGPASAAEMLRKGLALGADSAIHVVDDALVGSDMLRTSAVLAAALQREGFDLIICGNESTDGRGGSMAAMVAEQLGVPHASYLNTVEISTSAVAGERAGEQATRVVRAPLPAVISVTEHNPEPRFASFKGLMRAKKKPIHTVKLSDLDIVEPSSHSAVRSITQRPARAAGRKIVDDGTAANELVEFLTSSHLI
ncbi:electron transfer flavoprotein subunit beta [Cryobacterium roopkundense]|uniref:Electron transfer flavoprotein subunit beta n=1 Tax=Cryobacterium roopkundense TaxID=1001240 RepID=A0A099J5W7_9MICO|nr:electron transfer flavoprotein subunit beta/FixA family protein [Cryobacterium roopkundense]KGJ73470.1 electron transfer flavoprotein subunit beta [Cryobacterium roopkundense]MBB5641014.1 electron transfer flavoprotein beta subunit [Cryobacterium roopkundense]